jgi:hypothetical protein
LDDLCGEEGGPAGSGGGGGALGRHCAAGYYCWFLRVGFEIELGLEVGIGKVVEDEMIW